jgi:hypothetical protein
MTEVNAHLPPRRRFVGRQVAKRQLLIDAHGCFPNFWLFIRDTPKSGDAPKYAKGVGFVAVLRLGRSFV